MDIVADRVARRTAPSVRRRIDEATVERLMRCADLPGDTGRRLVELDREWDTDRVLEIEAATTGLVGLALGAFVRKPLLAVPALVAGAVIMHATTGRYPLMPLFRRLGLRTAREIARERYALKALRGDFVGLRLPGATPEGFFAATAAARGGPAKPTFEMPAAAADDAAPDAQADARAGSPTRDDPAQAGVLPATARRVELHTAPQVNDSIRRRADARIVGLEGAPAAAIDRHLRAMEREWDVERALQTNASLVVLAGLALAAAVDRRFLLLPAGVFAFFAQHALQGWCPPIPLFRRAGMRTRREIERERHALKALRGDFDPVPGAGEAAASERVRLALAAVDR